MTVARLDRLKRRGLRPGLERIRALLARLGHPERAFRVVLVGGSNGKGSTARALAAILQAAGERVGLFTSPHRLLVGERIEVDGRRITDAELATHLEDLWVHVEAVEASYFEALAALALAHFAARRVGTAVLEVGLGGRFDAVNATEPELSIVTQISLEHTDWLGPTLAHIAREKAGILRPGRPALSAATGAAAELLAAEARKTGAPLTFVRPWGVEPAGYGVGFSLGRDRYHGALMGRHQADNLALAVRAAERLGAGAASIREGLARLDHPGRLEYHPEARLLLDGAHNPAGARALARALYDYFPTSPKTLVLALSKDKDAAGVARALAGRFRRVLLTAYPGERSADPASLRPYFAGATLESRPQAALERALAERPCGGLVVAAGSLYLLAALTADAPASPAR